MFHPQKETLGIPGSEMSNEKLPINSRSNEMDVFGQINTIVFNLDWRLSGYMWNQEIHGNVFTVHEFIHFVSYCLWHHERVEIIVVFMIKCSAYKEKHKLNFKQFYLKNIHTNRLKSLIIHKNSLNYKPNFYVLNPMHEIGRENPQHDHAVPAIL